MSFVTFIIPTVGRTTLGRALDSLEEQTDPDWSAIVNGDGVDPRDALTEPTLPDDRYVTLNHLAHAHHESVMRNRGVAVTESPWVAFLDDDDTLDPHYVEWLKASANNADVVIFRQNFPKDDGTVAVFPKEEEIVWGNVGISYAVRTGWALRYPFKLSMHEDLLQLVAFEARGARIHFSPHVAYYGRDCRG